MTITAYVYNNTAPNLVMGQWQRQDYFIGARLLTSQYTHNPAHATYADVSGFGVGAVVKVEGKTVSQSEGAATLDCSPLDFVVQGTFQAGWVALFEMDNETTPDPASKLITAIKLNEVTDLDESVNELITISPTGLLKISPAGAPAVDPDVPVDPVDPNAPKACTIGKTIDDPDSWEAGDVICVSDFQVDPISLTGYKFPADNPVTIRTTNNTKVIATGLSGKSIFLDKCEGMIWEGGWDLSGGLDGWWSQDCSYLTTKDMYCHDVGQELFVDTIKTPGASLTDIHHINPKARRSGLKTEQFGEAFYAGNGQFGDENIGTISNYQLTNIDAAEIKAEAIDIKGQVISATISGGIIDGCEVPFNGAVTVVTDDALSAKQDILVQGLTTRNVTHRNGNSIHSHYAIGNGTVRIIDCNIELDSSVPNQYGINIYKNFGNRDALEVRVGDNKFTGAPSSTWIRVNRDNGGTGAELPGELIIERTGKPYAWFDASNPETMTISGDKVTEWRDLSANKFNLTQSDATKQPVTGGDINGKNAITFDGIDDFMGMVAGPQILDESMFFVVFKARSIAGTQSIVSFNSTATDPKIGVGLSGNRVYYRHAEDEEVIDSPATTGVTLVCGYRNGTLLGIDQDGFDVTNINGETLTSVLGEWVAGSFRGSNEFFSGQIGEIKVYNYFDQSDFDAQKLALTTKWAIDVNNFGEDEPVAVTDFAPSLWLDASDSATITAGTGSDIAAWNDKSGNARNFSQSAPSLRPQTGVQLVNGLNSVSVTAGESYLNCTTGAFTARSLIAVFVTNGDADNEYTVFGAASNGIPAAECRWRPATPQIRFPGAGGTATGDYYFNGTYSGYVGGFFNENGVVPDNAHVIYMRYTADFDLLRILGKDGFTNAGNSHLCELIVFDYELSAADRGLLEGYLSDKWGGSL